MLIESFKVTTCSNIETEELGCKFSQKISKGDIIGLNGNLGSGKTTFVKGILKGLNYNDEVTSPTYTLINEYCLEDYRIIHIDCYREKNINRWLNIGLIDYLSGRDILFIEWAENIQSILPNEINNMYFNILDFNKRLIKCNE
tara:strand:+ start:82 stop:510 length:429 start_codon:yes stop_codon:yes gene_type:complete